MIPEVGVTFDSDMVADPIYPEQPFALRSLLLNFETGECY